MFEPMKESKLLDEKGNLIESGFSYQLVKEYDRKAIKAPKLKIKEWDYYYIGNGFVGIALTISDVSYLGLNSVSFLDFKNKTQITKSEMTPFPMGKTHFPKTSKEGYIHFKNKKLEIEFENHDGIRHLKCFYKNFRKNEDFSCDVILSNEPRDTMVIATPFEKPKHFYYNQKINCMKAKGFARIGATKYDLDNALGVLDWGRGVWTYINTWYWSSLNAIQNNHLIGFNLGYGFGINLNGSENMIFKDGIATKVEDVFFDIPKNDKKDDFLANWTIKSKDGKINLKFEPILDRYADSNVLIIRSLQHQVFGKFSGTLKFDDEIVEIKNLVGFAEKVYNRW